MNGYARYPWLWIALTAILLSPSCCASPDIAWPAVKRGAGTHQPGNFWGSEQTQRQRAIAAGRPEILWRGELTRTPQEVQSVGGLYAEGLERLARNESLTERQRSDGCSLFLHAERRLVGCSQYISTSTDPFSATHLEALERNITRPIEDYELYLYKIHIDQSMFEVNASLGGHYRYPLEPEWVTVGVIPWRQIMGYYKFKLTGLSAVFDMNYKIKDSAQFFENPKYDAKRYDRQQGGGPQAQLAGFPSNSPAWTKEPWKAFRNMDKTQLLGQYVWHRVCGRNYLCYRRRRPILRAASLTGGDDLPEHRKEAQVRKDPPRVIFFSHFLWPDEAKRQHGFLSAADLAFGHRPAPGKSYTLQHHLDLHNPRRSTFYLQGSENFGTAAEWAARLATRHTAGFRGVVYAVHATPNMIDITLTRGQHYGRLDPVSQRFAIAGGIKWTQVEGWVQVPENYTKTPASDIGTADNVRDRFERAFSEKVNMFQRNPDYDKTFDQFTANDKSQMQLFNPSQPKKALKDFMDQYATVLGWTGDFPLFHAPQIISARESATAKAKNQVPHPHSESMMQKLESFFERHPVAVSLLPQAAALVMIPGFMALNTVPELIETSLGALKSGGWAFEILVGVTELGAAGAVVAAAQHAREIISIADGLEEVEEVLESV
ncbi:putative heat-labile enterotoxin [Ophiocordyceps polyrhachis-furcata BCC 54312]|uniref:Heat-labile enterotoxin n=1 Tax=Ophiocordyceps polyrhachis-furcata BCC 54312 TaxID=1330021 RepID=A0A367L5W6_9HYPO|nr:putative heat-labile enterotoxin [Ophiocordyceps polyrhachis-furcata BCC 54312]